MPNWAMSVKGGTGTRTTRYGKHKSEARQGKQGFLYRLDLPSDLNSQIVVTWETLMTELTALLRAIYNRMVQVQ